MTIEERLANLELQLGRVRRRNHWYLGMIVVLAGGLIVPMISDTTNPRAMAQAPGTAKEIRANKFVLVDQNGKTRASLEINELGPTLALKDGKGKDRVLLSVWKESSPCLHLIDDNGIYRVSLSAAAGSDLILRDEKSYPSFVVSSYGTGCEITMAEATGQFSSTFFVKDIGAKLSIDHLKSGRTFEVLSHEEFLNLSLSNNAQRRAQFSLDDGGTSLGLFDRVGNLRFSAGKRSVFGEDETRVTYPESSLLLFGPDGKVIWSAIK
jgi:hypothetical protein